MASRKVTGQVGEICVALLCERFAFPTVEPNNAFDPSILGQ